MIYLYIRHESYQMLHKKPSTNIARHAKRLYWHLLRKGRYEQSLKALELRVKARKLDLRLGVPVDYFTNETTR